MKKDLISISDLSQEEILPLFDLALKVKASKVGGGILRGKTLAMIFEKPSLRTRVTFEVGMTQLGGHAIYLGPNNIQLGKRETVADGAQNLSRWVDGIMARTFAHRTVLELAQHATVPVINGLTDEEHPCQALTCGLTLIERQPGTSARERSSGLRGQRLVFVGDGNNVAHSLMLMCPMLGMDFVIACPEGYAPKPHIAEAARRLAAEHRTSFEIMTDPHRAVRGGDVIYTDVWASMGQEAEQEARARVFRPYQVNSTLVKGAKTDCLVTHCLPAHRGKEITNDVLDGPQSIALDEAENRLHIQKAVLITWMAAVHRMA